MVELNKLEQLNILQKITSRTYFITGTHFVLLKRKGAYVIFDPIINVFYNIDNVSELPGDLDDVVLYNIELFSAIN